MGLNFQQEDGASITCGAVQACAVNALALAPFDHRALVGGTAGNVEDTGVGDIDGGQTRAAYMFEMAPVETDWAAGNATIRWELFTENMQLTWAAVYLCQRSSACVAKATYGSATGLGQGMGSVGIFTTTVSCSAITALTTDLLYVVLEFTGNAGMNQTCGIIPSQIIDTPIFAVGGALSIPVAMAGYRRRHERIR